MLEGLYNATKRMELKRNALTLKYGRLQRKCPEQLQAIQKW